METSKKVICAFFATTISACCFSQLNLGLQSTTNAALNAAAATNAISKVSAATTANTSKVVNTAISKSQQIQTTVGTLAGSTSGQVGNIANSAGNASITGNLSSTINNQSTTAGSAVMFESAGNANTDLGVGGVLKKTGDNIQPVKETVSKLKTEVTKNAGTVANLGKETATQAGNTGETKLSSEVSSNTNIRVEKK